MPQHPDNAKQADFNVRMIRPLARYLLDHHGRAALESAANRAGITAHEALSGNKWIYLEQMEDFFSSAYDFLGNDDDTFLEACSYRMGQAYGPLRLLFWASTPKMLYKLAMKTARIVSKNANWDIVDEGIQRIRVTYEGNKRESRLLCIGRQANARTLPTIWKLSPARVEEHRCIARGDDVCEYEIHWQPNWRWLSSLGGLVTGLLAAWLLTSRFGFGGESWVTLPLLGAAVAGIVEFVRVRRADKEFAAESHRALEELGEQEAGARREIVSLHQRQQHWNRMMEMQIAERDAALEKLVEKAQEVEEERVVSLRGFTHDIRSPLTVLRGMHGILSHYHATIDDAWPGLLEDHEKAIEQMSNLVAQFLEVGEARTSMVKMSPEPFRIEPLSDRLRRRMQALVFGRDIRVSVFATREAPDEIIIDPLLFDRITDNLMTNAAKYTRQGSIIIEIGGVPGYLSLKISDTGKGIDEEKIEQIFTPGGSDPDRRAPDSYGIGLSVVVRLLDEIGGRLEIMSKPEVGTTFWVYLPRALPDVKTAKTRKSAGAQDLVGKIVTIRKTNK